MRDEDERLRVLAYRAFEYLDYLAAVPAVEVSGGLVRENELGLVYQRARKGYPLLLTARELARVTPALARQTRQLEQFIEVRHVGLGAVEVKRKHNVLLDIEHWNEVVVLEYEADRAPSVGRELVVGLSRHLVAVEVDFARGGRVERADDVEQSGLAAAALARDGDELPAPNLHIDVVERHDLCLALAVLLEKRISFDDNVVVHK